MKKTYFFLVFILINLNINLFAQIKKVKLLNGNAVDQNNFKVEIYKSFDYFTGKSLNDDEIKILISKWNSNKKNNLLEVVVERYKMPPQILKIINLKTKDGLIINNISSANKFASKGANDCSKYGDSNQIYYRIKDAQTYQQDFDNIKCFTNFFNSKPFFLQFQADTINITNLYNWTNKPEFYIKFKVANQIKTVKIPYVEEKFYHKIGYIVFDLENLGFEKYCIDGYFTYDIIEKTKNIIIANNVKSVSIVALAKKMKKFNIDDNSFVDYIILNYFDEDSKSNEGNEISILKEKIEDVYSLYSK